MTEDALRQDYARYESAEQLDSHMSRLEHRGEIVASMPVLDDLPEGYQVAVENSAIVYDDSEGTVSTIVCNWFGAGSAGLADPDSDSSIQSYANIYDTNWLTKGNCMIAPAGSYSSPFGLHTEEYS